MSNHKYLFRKASGFVMAFLMLVTSLTVFDGGITAKALVESVNGSDSLVRTSLDEIKNVLTSISYAEYLRLNSGRGNGKQKVVIDINGHISKDNTSGTYQSADGKEYGTDGKVLLVGDDGKITFDVEIPEDGSYDFQIEYYTGNISIKDADGKAICNGKSTTIERMVLIDGKVPYKEARSIAFSRSWVDSYPVLDENFKAIKTDGKKEFYDSLSEKFLQHVVDSSRIFQRDNNGNELKPEKTLNSMWRTTRMYDSSGYSIAPLKFFFEKGKHTVTLGAVREPFAIKSLSLVPSESLPTYEEYLKEHSDAKDFTGDTKYIVQAEYPSLTSDRTIYQVNDRTSVITQPQDSSQIRYNVIGGDKWTYVGQWIEYRVNVAEAGFYTIIPRSLQNMVSGAYVSRKIYINDAIPFSEASYLRFYFTDYWQTKDLTDGTTPFKFYLKEGQNKIRFEVSLGDLSELLSTVATSLNNANAYYRKILMITGPDPDEYRDYSFERTLPDVVRGLGNESKIIYDVSKKISDITGSKGEVAGPLEKVALTLERMYKYPNKIASTMGSLKDYLAALGSWLTTMQNQPLLFDYLSIQAVTAEKPRAEANFFDRMIGEIKKFYMSFFADYTSVSSSSEKTENDALKKAGVEVWTSSSRDQAQIIRTLVDDDFMERYNIPINVKLVTGDTLLPATLAGTGPDVSMGNAQSTPINYAIRSAVLSLNDTNGGYDFNDFSKYENNPVYKDILDDVDTFDEVTKRFAPTAMVPLTLYGKAYGIPENMSFSMMFYRKDIFAEQNIKVPDTWDDFKAIISTLQAKTMDIGFPTGVGGSTILMYQQGEKMYDEGNYDSYLADYPELFADGKNTYTDENGKVIPKTDGMTINLDSDIALSTFNDVCKYFTNYSFPVTYTFPDRFRNGTMPLGILDYTTYNTLIVFAPEIKGLWEFTPLPGTKSADGSTINNTSVASVSAMIMMRSVTDDNAFSAWTFMQWWTSAKIQSSYANEMEALLGPSAKQNTANIEALELMAWSKDELDSLKAQFNAVTCTPEYPGSYIIGRYTNFAFLGVYNKGDEPIAKMLSYINDINSELSRKRKEFKLITIDTINEANKTDKKSD